MPSAQNALPTKAQAIIATAVRSVLSPKVIEETGGQTILVPVRDDRFSPALRCGEFAIVDTRQMRLEDGALYYKRDNLKQCYGAPEYAANPRQSLSIVEIGELSPSMTASLAACNDKARHPAPFWMIGVGWSPVIGGVEAFAQAGCKVRDGHVLMSDGPMSEKNLQPMIVGRVIGVLGAEGHALRWKDAQ